MIYSMLLAKGGLFDPIAKPLAAVLAFFYSLVPNYGIAIVLLTIAMMIVLTPLTIKQTRSMLVMQKLQPEMKKLQEIHKNDRQALNEAVMALYKEHNASPLGGCLPMLLPFPLFIALLRVLEGLSHTVHQGAVTIAEPKYLTAHTRMYKDIVAAHGQLDAFGMNLAKSARSVGGGFVHSLPYFVLLLLMVGTQFYQQYQLTSKNPAAKSQPGQAAMMKFIPLFFGLISLNFPAGVVLYWTVSNIIRVGQQWALYRYDPKVKALVAKDVKEIEAKTREIEATHKDKPASGRARFRDLLSNAAEAAADRRSPGGKAQGKGPGGKGAAKPGAKPLGDKSSAPGKAGRTPPGKATTGTSGAASKSLRPATPAGAKATGNQKGNQRPGAPKGVTSKSGSNKAGGAGGGGGAAKPGGAKAGGGRGRGRHQTGRRRIYQAGRQTRGRQFCRERRRQARRHPTLGWRRWYRQAERGQPKTQPGQVRTGQGDIIALVVAIAIAGITRRCRCRPDDRSPHTHPGGAPTGRGPHTRGSAPSARRFCSTRSWPANPASGSRGDLGTRHTRCYGRC